jgi:hypothetical protein
VLRASVTDGLRLGERVPHRRPLPGRFDLVGVESGTLNGWPSLRPNFCASRDGLGLGAGFLEITIAVFLSLMPGRPGPSNCVNYGPDPHGGGAGASGTGRSLPCALLEQCGTVRQEGELTPAVQVPNALSVAHLDGAA